MRILFSTTPGMGHVQPVIPLARAAAAAGHDVRWATGPDAAALVDAAGLATVVMGASAPDRARALAERYPEAASVPGPERADFMFPRMFGDIGAGSVFPHLLELATSWRPDVIVHEQAELAAPIVAAAVGVPNACHSFGLALPAQRVDRAAPFTRPLWEAVGLEPRPLGGCYDHLYIDIAPPSLQPDPLPHLGRRVHRRPEAADDTTEVLPPSVEELLDRPRPKVYLTFGTVFNVNPVFATAVDALSTVDAEVIVTVGPGGDAGAFGAVAGNVHVERYVPQSRLLPQVDLVVSHAGSGTFLGALAAGLPQLCIPQAADQFQNAQAGERAGVALALRGPEVTAPAVTEAAQRLLDEPTFRQRARAIATEIEAMPPVEDVVAALETLGR